MASASKKNAAAGSREIALLRAVNIGPHGKISMAALAEVLAASGLREVRTLLNSGNATFAPSGKKPDALELELEKAVEKKLGLQTDFFVRTAAEWDRVLASNPFPEEAKRDPGHLIVMPLKRAPEKKQVAALQAAAALKGREQLRANGRELYMYYPDGVGESKLTIRIIERHLETSGTGRNWNTALRLAAAAQTS